MSSNIANIGRGRWAVLIPAVLLVGCSAPAVGNATTGATADLTTETTANAAVAVPVAIEPLPAPSDAPSPVGVAGTLPADVTAFKTKRDECDHFRGEEPTDPARASALERNLERTCTGTDAALAALRKRYVGNAAVIAALKDYDDSIE